MLGKYPSMLYLTSFLSAVGGFLFGYDTGVIAGALPLVEKVDDFFPEEKSEFDQMVTWFFLPVSNLLKPFADSAYLKEMLTIGKQRSHQPLLVQLSYFHLLEVL